MATLPDTIQRIAEETPERTALVSGSGSYSYRSLMEAVRTLADALVRQGRRRIGLCGDNTPAWVMADLACQVAGVVCVPVPSFFSTTQVSHLVQQAGLDALLWPDTDLARTSLGQGVWMERLADSQESIDLPAGTSKVTFTSGSTGTPRGVCLSLAQMLATAEALRQRLAPLGINEHLCLLPLATLLENIAGVYLPLTMGATLRVEPLASLGLLGSSGVDARTLVAALNRWQPESLILVPELARVLLDAVEADWLVPDRFRFIAVGGGKVAASLLSRAQDLGLPLYEGYGLSECGSVVALNVPGDNRPGAAGRPLGHVQVRVNAARHIEVRGLSHLGYLGDRQVTQEWLDTGDLGHLDREGFLHVDGRFKNLIITGFGRNISPEWLEAELVHGLGVHQAVVFGDGAPRPSALVAVAPGQSPSVMDERLRGLNDRLPDYARLDTLYQLHHPLSASDGYLTANGRPVRDRIQADLPAIIAGSYPIHTNRPGGHSMAFFERLQAETEQARTHVTRAPVINAVREGRVTLESYTWFLTQAFHHVKHTVPLMMACGGRLPDRLESVRKALVEYIEEEVGHHEWILDDLAACGLDREECRASRPDLSIELMVAYLYHQIDRGNPAAFFGMVQVLEGTSVELATPLATQIQTHLGLPDSAFSYLYSHGALDQEHFEFFRRLMDGIADPDDQQAIIDAARVVYRLYGDMLRGIPLPDTTSGHYREASDHAVA